MKLQQWLDAGVPILDIARGAHRDLNESVATVDAARALATFVLHENAARPPKSAHLVHNSLQITFGAVLLTLRRFREDWSEYMAHLFTAGERPTEAKDLIREIARRKLLDAANALFAHSRIGDGPPLSSAQRVNLVIACGWTSEEDVVTWYPSVCVRLMAVRDAIAAKYPGSEKYPITRDDVVRNDA